VRFGLGMSVGEPGSDSTPGSGNHVTRFEEIVPVPAAVRPAAPSYRPSSKVAALPGLPCSSVEQCHLLELPGEAHKP